MRSFHGELLKLAVASMIAFSSISMAVSRASGNRCAIMSASMPVPVPMSRMRLPPCAIVPSRSLSVPTFMPACVWSMLNWRKRKHLRCTMDDVRCTMYDGRCTMYDVRWRMYDGGCTMDDVRWTMCDGRCTMYDVFGCLQPAGWCIQGFVCHPGLFVIWQHGET